VLDEPTNHLDMRSKEMLKMALQKYNGTLIVVSHDRNFLHGLTNHIYEFRAGSALPYIGDIYDFLRDRKGALDEGQSSHSGKAQANKGRSGSTSITPSSAGLNSESGTSDSDRKQPEALGSPSTKAVGTEGAPTDPAVRKEWERLRKKRIQVVEKAEAEVSRLEGDLLRLEAEMSSGDFAIRTDQDQIFNQYAKAKDALASAMDQWEQAQADLDALAAP
jgi:ATP-binding cassette subfamily F protein 3